MTDFSRLHYGIFIALAMVVVMWFILEKTTTGFELKAVGFNQHASEYAGMNVIKILFFRWLFQEYLLD